MVTVTGKSGNAIALPPVAQFVEGDRWNAYDASGNGTIEILGKKENVVGHVLVRKKNGAWVLDDNDTGENAMKSLMDSHARIFSDLHLEPAA